MSETISAWTWPEIETVDAIRATLLDVLELDIDIVNIEKTQIYATSAEDLAKYRRDAKIAEATYTVLTDTNHDRLQLDFNQKLLKFLNMQSYLETIIPKKKVCSSYRCST